MTATATLLLHQYESQDIFDVVAMLEKSFGLCFADDAFAHVNTFGELCVVFEQHISYPHRDDCTSQQAFYRVRKAMADALSIDAEQITPDSRLASFFPKRGRRRKVKAFQAGLGIKVDMLTCPGWLVLTFVAGILLSLAAFFFDWKIAVGGLTFFILAIKVAAKLGNTLRIDTVKELTQQLAEENYLDIRRSKGTINRKEIVQTIVNAFSRHLDIEPARLTPDAKFSWA